MKYQERFYAYQTIARGLLDAAALEKHFVKLSKVYWGLLKPYLPVDKNSICIDMPCGYGNFLYFLRSRGFNNIQGCDFDNAQVKLANIMGLPALNENIFELIKNDDNKFDLVSSFDFIEHISKNEALVFLDGCFNLLNDGGVLILRTPCSDGPFGAHDAFNDLTHEWAMTSNLLKTLLNMVGFTKVVIIDESPRPTDFFNSLRWAVSLFFKFFANLFCIGMGVRPPAVWSRSMIAIAYR